MMQVDGNLNITKTKTSKLPDSMVVNGNMCVYDLLIGKMPENLIVKGSLHLTKTHIKALPKQLRVGGCLYLAGTPISSLPDNLVVGKTLDLRGTLIQELPSNLVVGENLMLTDTSITQLPDNLVVGGYLDLSGTKINSLPKNLVVGTDLYLDRTAIKTLPSDLKVGGSVWMDSTIPNYSHLKDGEYEFGRYLYLDGVLTHIKKERKIHQYTYYIGKIREKDIVYDGINYAQCNSFREGVALLDFVNRGIFPLTDNIITKKELISMYNLIISCNKRKTQNFIDNLDPVKDNYTVREILEMMNRHEEKKIRSFLSKCSIPSTCVIHRCSVNI